MGGLDSYKGAWRRYAKITLYKPYNSVEIRPV